MNHTGKMIDTCRFIALTRLAPCYDLRRQFLCQEDDDGAMLVADCLNDRLQVMDGRQMSSIVNMHPAVYRPRGAVYVNDVIYVISDREKKLYCYTAK